MPEDLSDIDAGGTEIIFPNDNPVGLRFSLRETKRYDADEVRDEIGGDVPEFGNWFPIEKPGGDEAFLGSTAELVNELQRVENPVAVTFEVTQWRQPGDEQTSQYEVVLEVEGDTSQDSL